MTTASPILRPSSRVSHLARTLASLLADRVNRLADDVENACDRPRRGLPESTPAVVSALSESRREVAAAYERLRAELPEGANRGVAEAEMWLLREVDAATMARPSMLRIYWKPGTMREWAKAWEMWAAEG